MHGTGELFESLVQHLDFETQFIELPAGGVQSSQRLSQWVVERLPRQPHVLLAESFSGCLVPEILQKSGHFTRGLIFVASFVTCPNQIAVKLAQHMPAFLFSSEFLLRRVIQTLFLNGVNDKALLRRCTEVVQRTPVEILKARLSTLFSLNPPPTTLKIPTIYCRAHQDRVIGRKAVQATTLRFSATIVELTGPHFLLQSMPKQCAFSITSFIREI